VDRPLGDPELVRTFLLGYVQEGEAALGHEGYVGRLSIPYLTPSGAVSMRFRDLSSESSVKYLGLPGDNSTHLFNVTALFKANDQLFITEGELDAVAATAAGAPAIGCPGARAWKPHYTRMLEDFDVIVLCDGDDAGKEFGTKVCDEIEGARKVIYPSGVDTNEYLLEHGVDPWLDYIGYEED